MALYDDDGNEVDLASLIDQHLSGAQTQTQEEPGWRKALRTKAEKADEKATAAETRAAALERELAFAKAGVPLDHKMTPYFTAGYQGDLTPEAIKAAAMEVGLVQAVTTESEIPAGERESHERMAAANAGSGTTGGRNFQAEMQGAPTVKDLDRLYIESGGKVVDD